MREIVVQLNNVLSYNLKFINQFLDKPNRPNGPIEVVDVRAEKATVKWKKPDDWQGSDITGYTLEKMDMVSEICTT